MKIFKFISVVEKIIYVWKRDGGGTLIFKILYRLVVNKQFIFHDNEFIKIRKKFSMEKVNNFNSRMKNKRIIKKNSKIIINWFIPPFDEVRSGGHKTIARFIKYLENKGYINRIYLFPPPVNFKKSIGRIKKVIKKYFYDLKAEILPYTDENSIKFAHITIATEYRTAYPVYFVNNTYFKAYFIQDYEPLFFPMSSEYIYAENTYKMKFFTLCASPWLYKLMRTKYKLKGGFFYLGVNNKEYKVTNPIENRENSIIVYSRLVTPRRGFELLRDALGIVKREAPDVKIYFFGDDFKKDLFPYSVENLGILTPAELNEYYNKCSIGLVSSLTNYSLIPNEMMQSGLLVIDMAVESTKAIYGDLQNKPIILSFPTPLDIANTLLYYLENKNKRYKIIKNGLNYVKKMSWENSFRKVEKLLLSNFVIK